MADTSRPNFPRLAIAGAIVALALVNLLVIAGLVVARTPARAMLAEVGAGMALLYDAGLATATIASLLAAGLVLRGSRRPEALSLAAGLATTTFACLTFLSIFVPHRGLDSFVVQVLPLLFPLFPIVAVAGVAALLRFSVLFPAPLGVDDLVGVGASKPDDSLQRFERTAVRRVRTALGLRPAASGDGPVRPPLVDRLLDRLPERLGRIARRPLLSGAARIPVEPHLMARAFTLAAVFPYLIWYGVDHVHAWLDVPQADTYVDEVGALALAIWFLLMLVAGGYAIQILRHGYARADADGRRRMRWIIESLNVVAWGSLLLAPLYMLAMLGWENPVAEAIPGIYFGVFPLLMVMGLTVAVFYHGALEPTLVVRKSTLYGLFGFVLAFIFAVVEEFVTEHLTARLGMPDGTGTLVASGLIAAAVGGFHGRFHRAVSAYLERTTPTSVAEQSTAGEAGEPR